MIIKKVSAYQAEVVLDVEELSYLAEACELATREWVGQDQKVAHDVISAIGPALQVMAIAGSALFCMAPREKAELQEMLLPLQLGDLVVTEPGGSVALPIAGPSPTGPNAR